MQINKEIFTKTENKLRQYYHDIEIINLRKSRIINLKRKLEKLKDIETHIEPYKNIGISYSEKVQTSSSCTSYAETEYIKQLEKLEKQYTDTQSEIVTLESEIAEIETIIFDMEELLKPVDDICKKILKYRYGSEKYTYDKISMMLQMPPTTLRDWQQNTIKDIGNKLMQM